MAPINSKYAYHAFSTKAGRGWTRMSDRSWLLSRNLPAIGLLTAYDHIKKLRRLTMYNNLNNRMDICFLCPETKVISVDFVIEPGYPGPEVPEDFCFPGCALDWLRKGTVLDCKKLTA